MNSLRFGLKTKILLVTAGVVTLIMMAISLSVLFKWRSIIIEKQMLNSESIVNAFSIPIMDALIYAEQQELQKEDVLETYIDNFMAKSEGVRFIAITDKALRTTAHSNKNEYNRVAGDSLSRKLQNLAKISSSIYAHQQYGWIVETSIPLQIGGKRWGIARFGFDAEPIRKELSSIFLWLFALTIAVTGGTLAVLYLLINRVTSSLTKLGHEIDKIDFDSVEEVELPPGNDEIVFLIRHFNSLKKRLNQSKLQLERAQKQVYQSEKLASIGRLASGVAHEINNPINGIKNCLYAINREPGNKEQTKEYLGLVDEGVGYIENVIQKLLGFARQQSKSPENLEINELIIKVTRLLNYRIKQKQVNLVLQLAPGMPGITADGQLIQEVIMNLLINSLDAIPGKGTITVTSAMHDTAHIQFSVTDNGTGIPESEMGAIFDPFYTTKEPGVGTGLGLSVSLGIVGQHGGNITAQSIPGKETTFTVTLPLEVVDENPAH